MIRFLPAILVASCSAVPASAQSQQCAPSEIAYTALSEVHKEQRIFYGIAPNGALIELWAGDNTWSLLVTSGNGTSCLVASGNEYERSLMEPNL